MSQLPTPLLFLPDPASTSTRPMFSSVQPLASREVVDLGSDSEDIDLGSESEQLDLGSESDISDAERSQMHLPPNMRTNGSTFI